ncbi:hypothetical protein [Haliovirga abyssi]|uniref:GspL cytoplasmic actin-ATPase-like domain-containing protein n=1 Tax=Haliovirga abyssi TaxID=2996794 RepID=A0AAU9DG44_9FUSO|nr:hypothetical protein [Haliovirga abyssi]BDU51437.1 hypothetical protein HLVA_20060 [Haliovirga abyssi]
MKKKSLIISIEINRIKFILIDKSKRMKILYNEIIEIDDNVEDKKSYIINIIKNKIKDKKLGKNSIYLEYNFPNIPCRGLKIPIMPEDELKQVVKREVGKIFPDRDLSNLVYQNLGEIEVEGKRFYSIFYILLSKDDIDFFKRLNVKLSGIDFEVFSLDRIFKKRTKEEENSVLIDVSKSNTIIMIYKEKILEVYREIPIGWDSIVKSIMNNFQISREEALKKMKIYGYIDKDIAEELINKNENSNEDEIRQINFIYETLGNNLLRKIENSIIYFKNNNRGHDINTIYLTGEIFEVSRMEDFFMRDFSMYNHEAYSGVAELDIEDSEDFLAKSMIFSDMLGTILMTKPPMEFVREEDKKKIENIKKYKKISFFAIIFILPVLVIYLTIMWENIVSKKELVKFQKMTKELQPLVKEYDKLDGKTLKLDEDIKNIKNLNKDNSIIDFFYRLNEIAVERIYFTSIKYNKGTVVLNGKCISEDGFPEIYINDFFRRLEEEYKNVVLNWMKKATIEKKNGAEFSIKLDLEVENVKKNKK